MNINVIYNTILLGFSCVPVALGSTYAFPETKGTMNAIEYTMELYKTDCGSYPNAKGGLKALVYSTGEECWNGPYVTEAIFLDEWGNEIKYKFPGANNVGKFDLYSAGQDGLYGNSDDINNWNLRWKKYYCPPWWSNIHIIAFSVLLISVLFLLFLMKMFKIAFKRNHIGPR